jgi:hypothetical protein
MKYALLAYDLGRSLGELPAAEKRALHRGHAHTGGGVTVVSHYRLRSQEQAMTVRLDGDRAARHDGPADGASGALLALYVVESDDPDAVVAFAAGLPAVCAGVTVEIRALAEPAAPRSR